jgi:hypothetical protein
VKPDSNQPQHVVNQLRAIVVVPIVATALLMLIGLYRWDWKPKIADHSSNGTGAGRIVKRAAPAPTEARPDSNVVGIKSAAGSSQAEDESDKAQPPASSPSPAKTDTTPSSSANSLGQTPGREFYAGPRGAKAGGAGAGNAGIVGTVFLEGTPPPEKELPLDPACGKLHSNSPATRFYVVGESGVLADVVVYVSQAPPGSALPRSANPPAVLLDQVRCQYIPYVFAAQTGQPINVRNSDPLLHNVHPTPVVSGNPENNKAQLPRSPDLPHVFNHPENFLRFKCDIHPWMFAYVTVLEHAAVAVTGADGTFALPHLPSGSYTVTAEHRKAGKLSQMVTVDETRPPTPLILRFKLPLE